MDFHKTISAYLIGKAAQNSSAVCALCPAFSIQECDADSFPRLDRVGQFLYKRRMMLIATLMTAMAMCMHMCMPAAVGALEGSQSSVR
jgi:hypothetical protein